MMRWIGILAVWLVIHQCHGYTGNHTISQAGAGKLRLPSCVTNVKCVVKEWAKMTCSWQPNFTSNNNKPATYTLEYLLNCENASYFSDPQTDPGTCPEYGKDGISCMWPGKNLQDDEHWKHVKICIKYCVKITASAENIDKICKHEKMHQFNTGDIVEPFPIKSKSLKPYAKHINLSWNDGNNDKHLVICKSDYTRRYIISVKSQYGHQFNKTVEDTTNGTLSKVDGIRPYTNYTVEIQVQLCRINYDIGEKRVCSFKSNATVIHTSTAESVPGAAPEVTSGSYFLSAMSHNNQVMCTVFWKLIPKIVRHGVITVINICYIHIELNNKIYNLNGCNITPLAKHGNTNPTLPTNYIVPCVRNECGKCCAFAPTDTSGEILLPNNNASYIIYVQAKTSLGSNEDLELMPLLIPSISERISPPEHFIVEQNDTNIYITWSEEENLQTTVYWCRDHSKNSCKNTEIKWKIYTNQTFYAVENIQSLGIEQSSIMQYSFAISREVHKHGKILSSGMKFTPCIFETNKGVKLPDITQKPYNNSSIELKWDKLKCAETAYIESYKFFYKHKDGKMRTHRTDPHVTSTVIHNIHTSYNLKVKGISEWGETEFQQLKPVKPQTNGSNINIWIPIAVVLTIIIAIIAIITIAIQKVWRKKTRKPLTIKLPGEKDKFLQTDSH